MTAMDSSKLSSSALRRLVERGYLEQASDLAAIDAALAAGPVTFYNGYDPTAPSLHIGHVVTIMAMRLLQKEGHRPIVLMGGGTARVGDPSGKIETRKVLDVETVNANCEAIKEQFARFVEFEGDQAAQMVDNSSWLMKLGYIDFLRDIGRHFTVNRMVAVKTYRDRLESEQPLSFLEFNYQLLQAYDFHHLFTHEGCTLQVGGGDQWGNMIAGVELIRRIRGAKPGADANERDAAHCLTYKLLTTADGRKMGKTERGSVWLDPEQVSPYEYYQYWVNTDDRDTERALRLFTEIELDEIAELTSVEGSALNAAKQRLALEATALAHGNEAAQAAAAAARAAFGGTDWSALPCTEVPEARLRVVDLVTHELIAAVKSKREARKIIDGRGVRIDGEVVTDANFEIDVAGCGDDGLRLQVGKKRRFRIRLTGSA